MLMIFAENKKGTRFNVEALILPSFPGRRSQA